MFSNEEVHVKTFLDSKPFFTNEEPYIENVGFIISVLREFSVKNIDYLACDTLNHPDWVNYYALLTKETGVIVGASRDKTGNIKYGGDWIMESTSENIAVIYFSKSIEYYRYLLGSASDFLVAVNIDDSVWVTGNNAFGQLGTGDTESSTSLIKMTTKPDNLIPLSISCGILHTIVLMTNNEIWVAGNNSFGQLGTGDTESRTSLIKMTTKPDNLIPLSISCGLYHTIVLMTNNEIWGAGNNGEGQLGTGDTESRTSLTKAAGNNRYKYIADMTINDGVVVVSANICFPAGTPIQTDQGIIAIEKINPNIHTIRNNSIVDITKTISCDNFLVCFKKNALGLNYPSENTLMSKEHKVYYQGKMREAHTFLCKFKNVGKVKYNGKILYNVLMKEYSHMLVNNLICETLHPENIFAKLYTKKCKYTNDERDKITKMLRECIKVRDYKTYYELCVAVK